MRRRPSSTSKTSRLPSGGFSGWLLIPVLLTWAALLLPLASILSPSVRTPESVPYSMHSVLKADYSSEFSQYLHPALDVNIIREAILDQDSQADEARLAEIEDSLLTPVPTITPRFPATSAPQVQPTAAPTQNSHPRATAMIPWDPEPTAAAATQVQPTATVRPAVGPASTSPPPPNPKPRPDPNPKPKPTEAPAVPTDPPRPPQPPDPYPEPDPGGGPTPNPYP